MRTGNRMPADMVGTARFLTREQLQTMSLEEVQDALDWHPRGPLAEFGANVLAALDNALPHFSYDAPKPWSKDGTEVSPDMIVAWDADGDASEDRTERYTLLIPFPARRAP